MHKSSLSVCIVVLVISGCTQSTPPVSEAPRTADPSTALLYRWENCARRSYRNFEETMSDKNEAAERALEACHSEEIDFRSSMFDISVFPHLRASLKEVLINHEPCPACAAYQ